MHGNSDEKAFSLNNEDCPRTTTEELMQPGSNVASMED